MADPYRLDCAEIASLLNFDVHYISLYNKILVDKGKTIVNLSMTIFLHINNNVLVL